MKKTLAILLSLALLITAIPFATASANTYTTATDFYTLSNWVGPSSSNASADGSTYIEMGYLRGQERTFAMTLKANTVYTLSFRVDTTWGSNGQDKLYFDGGIKVKDASGTDIVTSRSGDDAWLQVGSGTNVTLQFTTGADTAYTLYFKGGWWTNNAALGGKFTGFALTEYVEPTDLENATEAIADKFTGTQYASIRAKDEAAGKAQGLRVRSDIDTSVLGNAALENCTVVEYGTLVAKTANLGGEAMTVDMVGTDKKVVKGIAYNVADNTDVVYKLDGTTKSFTLVLINIPVERFVTSYSYRAYAILEDAEGETVTVYGGATTPVSVESVATDIVASDAATAEDKAAAQTALDEYAAYEATLTPVYTTSADLYNLDNWTASNGNQYLSTDGSTYVQHTWLVNNTDTIAMTLKPNTTYTFSCDIGGTSDCNVTNEKYSNIKQVEVFASGDTSTALATTGNIGAWVYSWYAKTITLTFTTDATGECFVRVTGQNASNARGLVYKNLSIAEVAE